jgi:Spy/CpxP family protein refolding chaperone
MTRIGSAIGAAVLTIGLGSAALSVAGQQQNQAPASQGRRGGPDGFGGPGRGRGGPGGPGGPFDSAQGRPLAGLPLRELNLTDAQREQVKQIVDSRQQEVRAIGERAMAAREALHAATTSPSFDEGLIRAKAAEVASIEADMAVSRARIFADVFQLLTPEQQAKVKELNDSRPHRPNGQR